MTTEITILIGIVASIAAGFACAVAHRWAKRKRWGYIPRYVTGVVIGLAAFAFPLFAALPTPDALTLIVCIGLIFFAEGVATWLSHDADPDPPATLTPDAVTRWIDEELGK